MNSNSAMTKSQDLSVGQWKFSYPYGILSNGNEEELILEPRLSKLFYYLMVNRDEIVSRETLISNIWNGTIVNEESLTRAISDLRKVLNTHFKEGPIIQTIPKRGYKLSFVNISNRKPVWAKVLRAALYSFLALVLLILIVRGLNY